MGTGVSHSLAGAGHDVVLVDVSRHQLEAAEQSIRRNLRMYRVLGGSQEQDPSRVLERIETTNDLGRLARVDYVVENVTEKWSVKEQLYPQLDRICGREVVFAVNTSAIPITRVAGRTARPDRVIGVHFMNPVPLKPMVEVIRGHHTSDETIRITKELLSSLGKDCIVVEDSPGFVTNRTMMLTVNEAIFTLYEGVCTVPQEIDRLFKLCFGHKMGPLETADLIGLDTVLYSLDVLVDEFNDDKYRPCPLLRKMVNAGLLGRKSGEGFYPYPFAPKRGKQFTP